MDFLGSRWTETAPTSIEVLLRPTLGQSDEPSDLRGSLSPTSVYSTWQSPGGHPSNYEPGATLIEPTEMSERRIPYTALQTQDSKFKPWSSEAEHATSRSQRLPTILSFTSGWGRNIFVSFKLLRPGNEP